MALWTLFGLAKGRATTKWPQGDGSDGQDGVLGMPRYCPEECARDCSACVSVCPTEAITLGAGDEAHVKVDYGPATSASFAPKSVRLRL
jgi:ferredoxin